MSVVYESDRYRIRLGNAAGAKLIVTFDAWNRDRTGFTDSTATKLIFECGHAELSVQTSRNDWYLSNELDALLAAVSSVSRDYEHVVTYGSSMGGFAALLFAGASRAREVYAVSPQYSIDRNVCSFESRWEEEAATLGLGNIALSAYAPADVDGTLLFDPTIDLDRLQAERIMATFPNLKPIRLSFGGHPATKHITDARLLGTLGRDIVNGKASSESIRTLFKTSRRISGRYWLAIGMKHLERRPSLAEYYLRKVLSLSSTTPPQITFRAAAKLAELGDRSALKVMHALLQSTDDPPRYWRKTLRNLREMHRANPRKAATAETGQIRDS